MSTVAEKLLNSPPHYDNLVELMVAKRAILEPMIEALIEQQSRQLSEQGVF